MDPSFENCDRNLRYILLNYLVSNHNLSSVTPDIIDWANEKLLSEHNKIHICYLAGYTIPEALEKKSLFCLHFSKALQELGIEMPSLSVLQARTQYACEVCRDYLAGLKSFAEAEDQLYCCWREHKHDANDPAFKDARFNVWMYFSQSLNLVKDGYGGLAGFEDLTVDNYKTIFRREAEAFITKYAQKWL